MNKNEKIINLIKDIIFAVIAFLILNLIIVNGRVPSGSMEDTIIPKDRIIAFRWAYLFDEPQRGDIIIFKFPDNEKQKFVKRIIGLPNETVEIKNGDVYIDNILLEENYLKESVNNQNLIFTVPEDAYFVMGDNRNGSIDSRYWNNKFVYKDKILGKVILKYFPKIEIMAKN